MMRAYSPIEIERLEIPELPLVGEWEKAFGRPSLYERWFIEGESASGKSTFVMMLARMLCDHGSVVYLPLEERVNLSFKRRIKRLNMREVNGRFKVVVGESFDQIVERIAQPRSPQFWIFDSVQYMGVRFSRIKEQLLDRFPRKSFIFVSQSWKGEPKGRTANDLKFDAGVKIQTAGFRAYCSGRYIDDVAAYFTIWPEGAARYYLNE